MQSSNNYNCERAELKQRKMKKKKAKCVLILFLFWNISTDKVSIVITAYT